MGIESLLGQATDEQLKKLPGRVRNPSRIKQHLDAFALHLQGVSDRGVQEHFGWKSLSSAQNSIKRGEILAKNLNLDNEKIRLKLAAFFDEICDISLNQIKQQVKDGQLVYVTDNQGNETITKRRGVDTRLLGEAGRGAIRFAQFAGLIDSDKSTSAGGDVSTNVVFIQPSADATEWEGKTVNVTATGDTTGDKPAPYTPNASISNDDPLPRKQLTVDSGPSESDEPPTNRIVQRGLF